MYFAHFRSECCILMRIFHALLAHSCPNIVHICHGFILHLLTIFKWRIVLALQIKDARLSRQTISGICLFSIHMDEHTRANSVTDTSMICSGTVHKVGHAQRGAGELEK